MSDLISRDAAIAWFFRPYSNEECYSNIDVERALEKMPAVDAAPVVHGQWVKESDRYFHWHCSVCGFTHGVSCMAFSSVRTAAQRWMVK